MKVLKKVLLIAILTVFSILTMTITLKAATTVKITGDTVNIRQGPSTDTKVVAMLSKGIECEFIEEEGDWYKVKYKKYTGYVTKQYAEIIGEITDNNSNENANENSIANEGANNEKNETQNNNTQIDNSANKGQIVENEQQSIEEIIIYKKIKQNADIKILPLIHSSNIESLKKDQKVILLTETSGWSYIQTDSISGWVRSSILENSENNTNNNTSNDESNNNFTEKTAYINESYVNMRKGAGTSYTVIKVLGLNNEVTIIGEEGYWYKVKSGSDIGYISKDLVSDSKTVITRSNTTPRNEDREDTNSDTKKEEDNTEETSNSNTEKAETTSVDKQETTSKNETANKSDNSSTNTATSNTSTSTKNEDNKEEQSESSNSIKGSDIVSYAKKFLGHKYVYGGDGSDGTFDCSGFTMYVYKHFGISLPHGANSQYKSGKGTKISKQSELKEGDIVFLTDYETGVGIGHCGIYIGNGNFIHASTTTYNVIISSLNTTYSGRFYAGLRLVK